jgi:hypothetical protein
MATCCRDGRSAHSISLMRALDAQGAHSCWHVMREQGFITEAGEATVFARVLERTSSSAERTLIYRRCLGKRAWALPRSSGH